MDNGSELFGNTDIYLCDLILKGYFNKDQKILDIGCGEGRNLYWFLKNSADVYGIDLNPSAIQMLKLHSATLNPKYRNEQERFSVNSAGDLPFAPDQFDVVFHSAVAHFSKDENEFSQWWNEALRVLKPGGLFFMRTAMRFKYNDNTNEAFSFVPSYELIRSLTSVHELKEPLKIVEVPDKKREMGVIVFKKLT